MRYIVEWFDNGAGCATIEKEFENLEDARKAFNEMCFDYNQSTETDQQGVEILLGRVDESGDYEQLESYDGAKFWTGDREAGNKIECFDTLEQAREAIAKYEESDKSEGIYEEDFYAIYCEEGIVE